MATSPPTRLAYALAASLPQHPEEMETTNIINLEHLADACVRAGVRYFGQASSMVVYGSPRRRLGTARTVAVVVTLMTTRIMPIEQHGGLHDVEDNGLSEHIGGETHWSAASQPRQAARWVSPHLRWRALSVRG
jgi:nucleoside-diphosphate-sugar epimerase